MRNTIIILIISLIAVSCGKDKYTSAPQLKFKSISPNTVSSGVIIGSSGIPLITLNVTDLEGDLGFKTGKDTSKIFIKNLLINRLDSFYLPDLQSVASKNFQADIRINTFDILRGSAKPRPKVDTLIFEIYVQDFAKNKSNVITTEPLYYVFP
ncbi:MAG: hypothetical protein JWP81_3589 [Ferruginibacter sp.]|nr:hypothetical protein [Ferruginibacter sp.]